MARQKPKPEEVKRVVDKLSKAELSQLRKDNPFRTLRNVVIRKLLALGVKKTVISEISGLNDMTICEIGREKQGFEK